ncbi:MAG: quinone oxidoreductase [Euryarchaeota archaeon]|nr:quinone oxidoreductase [Euryarchaeota archaeon]
MRAVVVEAPGGPDALRYGETTLAEPGTGEARVRVLAAGVNFIDTYHRSGAYPLEPPFVPGTEGAGVVEAVGPGVREVAEGDRVAWAMQLGSYATHQVVPCWKLVPVPQELGSETAAAAMLQGMTAHYLSHSTYPLEEGDVALVHAAAGGVGQLLCRMAQMRGATVIGTCSTQEKEAIAEAAGAHHTIRYTEEDFVARAKALTKDVGVDVVYDGVGKTTFAKGLEALRPRGMMVLYGQASGPVPPIDLQELNKHGSLYVTRPSLAHYTATREELLGRATTLFDWIRAGKIDIKIDRTFTFKEAAEAHRYIEGRKTKGKLLLVP